MASLQGRSKVFTTGQAKLNPQHYVIKNAWVADKFYNADMAFCRLLCAVLSLSNLQITSTLCLLLNFCTIEYLVQHKMFWMRGQPIISTSLYAISICCIII